MTISQETHAAIEKLAAATGDLLRDLEAARDAAVIDGGDAWSDAADNVRRYLAMLRDGQAADDASAALRGANLLTTVNKGVGDAEIATEERVLGEKAFAVMKDAITAAAHLRQDAGLPF